MINDKYRTYHTGLQHRLHYSSTTILHKHQPASLSYLEGCRQFQKNSKPQSKSKPKPKTKTKTKTKIKIKIKIKSKSKDQTENPKLQKEKIQIPSIISGLQVQPCQKRTPSIHEHLTSACLACPLDPPRFFLPLSPFLVPLPLPLPPSIFPLPSSPSLPQHYSHSHIRTRTASTVRCLVS